MRALFTVLLICSNVAVSMAAEPEVASESRELTENDRQNPDACPTDAMGFADRARVCLNHLQYDEALKDIDQAIRWDSSNPSHYCLRALIWAYSDEFLKAIKDCNMAIRLDPMNARAHSIRGVIWERIGNFHLALKDFDRAILSEPKLASAYLERGLHFAKVGQFDLAVNDINFAAKLDPEGLDEYESLAWTRPRSNDRSQSMVHDEERLNDNRKDHRHHAKWTISDQWSLFAKSYSEVGEFKAAIEWSRKALESAPENKRQTIANQLVYYLNDTPFSAIPLTGRNESASDSSVVISDDFDETNVSTNGFNQSVIPDSSVDADWDQSAIPQSLTTNENTASDRQELLKITVVLENGATGRRIENDELCDRAEASKANGDFDSADCDFSEAIRLNPANIRAFVGRTEISLIRNEYDNVVKDADAAIALDPRCSKAYFHRGQAWEAKKEVYNAIKDYNSAILLDPRNPRGYFSRGNAWKSKEYLDRAIEDFTQTVKLDPQNAMAFVYRGQLWIKKENLVQALEDLNVAITLDPSISAAYLNRGDAKKTKGDLESAILDYKKAVALDPQYALAYRNCGICCGEKGDFENALANLEASIQIDSCDGMAFNEIAWIRATCPEERFRDGRKAVEFATKACELTEWKMWWIIDTLAAAYAEVGDFENAIKWQKQALKQAPDKKNQAQFSDAEDRLKRFQNNRTYQQRMKKTANAAAATENKTLK